MKLEAPFNGTRKQTLQSIYGVAPKYEPSFEVTGATLRRLFVWGVATLIFVWWLWP